MLYLSLVFGALGGLARGCVGILKAYRKKEKLSWKYFFITVFSSAVVGCVAALLVTQDYRFAVLVGYAGMDVLESGYKIYNKKF
tara:strand:- start:198 stop:449 length:252 start_codon:yes stop_codon:yes gene_type:complete